MDLSIKPKLGNITAELGDINVMFNTVCAERDRAVATIRKLEKENVALKEENKKLKSESGSEEVKYLEAKNEALKKENSQLKSAKNTKLK